MGLPDKHANDAFTKKLFASMGVPEEFLPLATICAEYIRGRMREPSHLMNILLLPLTPVRIVVVERSDGRTCWLRVGKKQQLQEGWNIFSEGSACRTACGDRPRVVRPSKSETVTCLSCIAAGRPAY